MTATSRHTALGIERDGRRVVMVAGHSGGGVFIRADSVPLSSKDVEHVIALLQEQMTNVRLRAQAVPDSALPKVGSFA